jgi:hypothetical protein
MTQIPDPRLLFCLKIQQVCQVDPPDPIRILIRKIMSNPDPNLLKEQSFDKEVNTVKLAG